MPSTPSVRGEPRPILQHRVARGILRSVAFVMLFSLAFAQPVAELTSLVQRAPQSGRPAVPPGDARFLVVGLTQDEQRTDTIMVVQWDDRQHRARILGIPRDIGIPVTGIGTTKIVHAFSSGGIGRTRIAVSKLLGAPISHYLVFSLPALRHLVDMIGGVAVTVEKRMVYTDTKQGLYIDLYPGPQVLDGPHAEQYVRFRHDSDADIGRIQRQQQFIRAALASIRRPTIWFRLPWIISTARNEVDTDLTSSQLLEWVRRVEGLTPDAISAYTITGHNVKQWDDLQKMTLDFWDPNPDDFRAKVRWLLTGVVPPPVESQHEVRY